MKDGSRVRTVRFEAPVYIAELHPYNQCVTILRPSRAEKQTIYKSQEDTQN